MQLLVVCGGGGLFGDAGCSFLFETVKVTSSEERLQDSVHRTLKLHTLLHKELLTC